MTPAGPDPILLGVLYDFPQHDGGASVEDAIRLGLEAATAPLGFTRPVELVTRHGRGLPSGSAHHMETMATELLDAGVLAIIGPSISDNALVVRPLVDAARCPAVNYTGGERTRSEWMFHYQVGSLAEEPEVLVRHLVDRGLASTAVVHDHSPVGEGYAAAFTRAAQRAGLELTARLPVAPLAEDLGPVVRRARAGQPATLTYLGLGVAARALALAVGAEGWEVPVVANSSLMFGYQQRDWRPAWEGWVYTDTVADDNTARAALAERSRRSAAGPVGVAVYDIGRLVGEALALAPHLTREGVREALEQVKRIPAASGLPGTLMGFGPYDHGALKGPYLVLRRWEAGRSVQLGEQ